MLDKLKEKLLLAKEWLKEKWELVKEGWSKVWFVLVLVKDVVVTWVKDKLCDTTKKK